MLDNFNFPRRNFKVTLQNMLQVQQLSVPINIINKYLFIYINACFIYNSDIEAKDSRAAKLSGQESADC